MVSPFILYKTENKAYIRELHKLISSGSEGVKTFCCTHIPTWPVACMPEMCPFYCQQYRSERL